MKRAIAIFLLLGLSGCASLAEPKNPLLGKWEQKHNSTNYVVFTATNLTLVVGSTQEVWQVVDGNNVVTGLQVTRGNEKTEAKAIVKFNEMIFRLGNRRWVLRKAGSRDVIFPPGEPPNQPDDFDKGDREQSSAPYRLQPRDARLQTSGER